MTEHDWKYRLCLSIKTKRMEWAWRCKNCGSIKASGMVKHLACNPEERAKHVTAPIVVTGRDA